MMQTSNAKMINFLISPALIFAFVFSLSLFIFGTTVMPIDVRWQGYLGSAIYILIILVMVISLHPPVFGKILPKRFSGLLLTVHKLRDLAFMLMVMLAFFPPQQFAGHLVFVLSKDLPLADATLAHWDAALGLDWMGYFQWVHDNPTVAKILESSYATMGPVTGTGLLLLMIADRTDRAFVLLHSFIGTGLVCVTIGAFFPALGATTYFIHDLGQFPNFETLPGSYAVESIIALRNSEGQTLFDPLAMPGLVTFPSFHTAGTIAIAFAFRRTALEIPMWIYAAVVISSTPVIGGHYMIDVIFGAVIGFGVCILIEKWMYVRRATYFPTESVPAGRIYSSPVTT